MIGLYPVCPGNMDYAISSPVFDKVIIRLDQNHYEGKELEIVANRKATTDNMIGKMSWNGKRYKNYFISHDVLTKGGKLEFWLKK